MGKKDCKNEKERKRHGYVCVPRELFCDKRYKKLSIEAKVLYACMLDRLKLSAENGWKDKDGKTFIYFSIESIMDLLQCSKGKAISTLNELDVSHGIGLIEKKRVGYGKCSQIYVKDFFSAFVSVNEERREKNEDDLEVTKKEPEKYKNQTTISQKFELIEVHKKNTSNNNISNNNINNIQSNHIRNDRKDVKEKITIEQQIKENIDYRSLMITHSEDVEQINEIINLITEVLAKRNTETVYIAGNVFEYEYVKNRFLALNNKHIQYVLFTLKDNKIKAISDLTEKELRQAHNLQKMYKAGAFNG